MQQNGLSRGRLSPPLLVAFLLPAIGGNLLHAADQIVLRDTTIIADRTVVGLDEDGVRLDDGAQIGWDRIDQGRISGPLQAEFDQLLSELGPHLYRIRQRLRVEDHRDMLPAVTAVYSRFKTRTSPTSYMVAQAAMWAYLANGEREKALEPYLRCFEMLRELGADRAELPGRRRLQFDARTGLTPELAPVWFNESAAQEQLALVFQAVQAMQRPRPDGAYLYYATMAIRAGEYEQVDAVLRAVSAASGPMNEFRQIVGAQKEIRQGRPGVFVEKLGGQLDRFSDTTRPFALYWFGLADLSGDSAQTRKAGLLRLLEVPARYGKDQPELSAAALYRSAAELERMDDIPGSVAVRNELLEQFGQTYFANQSRAENEQR